MKAKHIFFLISITFCVWSCTLKRKANIHGIRFETLDKLTLKNDSVKIQGSGIDIYFCSNLKMFAYETLNFKKGRTTIEADTIVNEMVYDKKTYKYFIYETNKKEGIEFDSLEAEKGVKFNVDSLLIRIGIHPSQLKVYSTDLGSPVKSFHKKNREQIEKYYEGKSDSTYRYFDKSYNKINFSFSPSLDSNHKSKLIRTVVLTLYPDSKDTIKYEFISQIRKIKIKDEHKLLMLFERFELQKKMF